LRSVSGVGRIAAVGAVIAAVALLAIVLFGPGDGGGYEVKARFINAGQIVTGNPVQTGGSPIGSVSDIKITDGGQAEIEFSVEDDYAPLPVGTRAAIRQFSQSGIANRYIDLTFPGTRRGEQQERDTIDDGGVIDTDETETAVDLDQLFNTLDPETRKALQQFFRGQAEQFRDAGVQANAGFHYLNPALSTSSRLFNELTRDQPVLERFLVDSSRLVTALAERRDDLASLVANANATTRALGNEKQALADSIELLPPFMRRANTTFVNLRAALDDVDPLVDASKPVAKLLGPFLDQARGFAADAEPTVADLRVALRRPGRGNDLVELTRTLVPLANIAVDTRERTVDPGGTDISVGETRGALQETIDAFKAAAPVIALARPYSPDFLGWLDDFSTTGGGFDALGAYARGQIGLSEYLPAPFPGPVKQGQYHRCPGGAEAPASDGSNIPSAELQEQLDCTEAHRATKDGRG
jgi:phospholipid/cholesterol/gamma-HCH transport system substrate-binding protein